MRAAYVHDAVVTMEKDADLRALGGAVTLALCGQWDHQPPCPLAPHHTTTRRTAGIVRARVLFCAEASLEQDVRQRIDAAMAREQLQGPDGVITRWHLERSCRGEVSAAERDQAERLLYS